MSVEWFDGGEPIEAPRFSVLDGAPKRPDGYEECGDLIAAIANGEIIIATDELAQYVVDYDRYTREQAQAGEDHYIAYRRGNYLLTSALAKAHVQLGYGF